MKYVAIAAAVILALFLIVLSQIPLGLEPLTEVYLENHTDLIKNAYLHKLYNFSFTTHNLEYQDVEYNYTVNAYDVNGTFMFNFDKGNFTLTNNETKTILVPYIFSQHFNRSQIQVEITKNLIGEPEFKRKFWWPDPNYPYNIDVHFWVDEYVPTQIIITPA